MTKLGELKSSQTTSSGRTHNFDLGTLCQPPLQSTKGDIKLRIGFQFSKSGALRINQLRKPRFFFGAFESLGKLNPLA